MGGRHRISLLPRDLGRGARIGADIVLLIFGLYTCFRSCLGRFSDGTYSDGGEVVRARIAH